MQCNGRKNDKARWLIKVKRMGENERANKKTKTNSIANKIVYWDCMDVADEQYNSNQIY